MPSNAYCGRPWTPYEDELLKAAVAIYGENTEKWKVIAQSVPGRTNKACRKRWLHSLSPTIKKSAWTPEEDRMLLSLFERYPNKWSRIAREIPGRTDDACAKRYRESLDPNLKKDEWTGEEDRRLVDLLMRYGGTTNPKWGLIGHELRRGGLACRNRWRLLERRKKAVPLQEPQSGPASVQDPLSTDVWQLFAEGDPSYWAAVFNSLNVALEGSVGPVAGPRQTSSVSAGEPNQELHRDSVSTEYALDGPRVEGDGVTQRREAAEDGSLLRVTSALTATRLASPPRQASSVSHVDRQTTENSNNSVPTIRNDEPTDYIFEVADYGGFDYEVSQEDGLSPYDGETRAISGHAENIVQATGRRESRSVETVEAAQSTNSTATNEANFISLGALAHTASTLSPSPCPPTASTRPDTMAQCDRVIIPPRKQRRTAVGSRAIVGMHVITGLTGKPKTEPRLSTSLPVAGDHSILAYVCGHSSCFWPSSSSSSACFATSGELLNHYKEQHMCDTDGAGESPFRCGLKGCNKKWKSVNGLQYHLQISKYHYREVCSRAFSSKERTADQDSGQDLADEGTDNSRIGRRSHKCPHTGCLKEYKQLSGLRYHLLHGHPKDMPAQLDVVPPRIAKSLGVDSSNEPALALASKRHSS